MTDAVTKEEAHRLLVANSYAEEIEECGHPGCTEHRAEGKRRIHTFRGPFGADWDLDEAEREVEGALEIRWVDHLFRHNLGVKCADGSAVYFDVPRPKVAVNA